MNRDSDSAVATGSTAGIASTNRLEASAGRSNASTDVAGGMARPHRLTQNGVEYDQLGDTKAPDMAAVSTPAEAPGRKNVVIPGSRSHEMSALLGRATRLPLKRTHVIKSVAFISNKGGVGKTHISTNMAFYLSRLSKNALLIDLDLSNSDVTNKLGFYCENTVMDLLNGKERLNRLTYNTPFGFDLIAGEPGNFKLANISPAQRQRLIRAFKECGNDYDFVLYDLSAGVSATTLDLALAQDYQIVVTTPQDIIAGYACIKAAFHRFKELEQRIATRDKNYRMRKTFRPFIILNQVNSLEEGRELYQRIQHVAGQNLDGSRDFKLETHFLGVVVSDHQRIRESELNRFLYSSEYGASRTGQCFNFLVQNLMQYRDPNSMTFTNKVKRFIDIFAKSVGETKYAQ